MKKIILASSSPRRKELLTTAGIEFEIHVKEVDETIPEGTFPVEAAKMTAAKKAAAVADDFKDCIVIGADTIVVANGRILGKPKDEADAKSMLRMLSGIEHEVITGVCIIRNGESDSFAQISKVKFYDLTDEEIIRDGKECGSHKFVVKLNRLGKQHMSENEYLDMKFLQNKLGIVEAKQHRETNPFQE